MTRIKEITDTLESFAPLAVQESYDNSKLLVGNSDWDVKGILLTLDCTEAVVEEAIAKGCNLIVAHHPIIFSGLKSITGKNYIERTVLKAIKNDIAIYACHTNLDNVKNGVSYHIAKKLNLNKISVLHAKSKTLLKLETYCPQNTSITVLEALKNAGAGAIGNYYGCSFTSEGTGRFIGDANSTPFIGKKHELEEVKEDKIEVILPFYLKNKVIAALKDSHPYEEVAYFLNEIINSNQDLGSGTIAELPKEMELFDFFDLIKDKLGAKIIRHTEPKNKKVKKVAICGGSGSFLLNHAISAGADVFITADFKYHEFFDAENKLVIADIGHYETESNTKELFFEILKEKFTNIAMVFTETNTNPVNYY